MSRRNNNVLQGIRPGQTITADWLSRVAQAVNRNSFAVSAPAQKTIVESPLDSGNVTNSSWSAGAANITDETVEITDSNSDTHDIERITKIVFTNDDTGETMTLNITY